MMIVEGEGLDVDLVPLHICLHLPISYPKCRCPLQNYVALNPIHQPLNTEHSPTWYQTPLPLARRNHAPLCSSPNGSRWCI